MRLRDTGSDRFTKAWRWMTGIGAASKVLPALVALSLLAAACSPATVTKPPKPRTTVTTATAMTWSAPRLIDPSGYLSSVSCPSPSFCVAVDHSGNAVTYNGASWSAPRSIDPNEMLMSVSCPSPSFCVAVDNVGLATTYSDGSWLSPKTVSGGAFDSVSCPLSELLCWVKRWHNHLQRLYVDNAE